MSTKYHGQAALLPVGVVVALIVGVSMPGPGTVVGRLSVGPIDVTVLSVVLIFLISGMAIHGVAVERDGFLRAATRVVALNLVLAPVLAYAFVQLSPVGTGLSLGVVVMAAVPTTLSSAAVTATIAGGDRAWAVGLTVLCVSVGAVTAPIAVSLALVSDASVPPGPLLVRVVVIVVVPLAVGFLVARLTGCQLPGWTRLVPSLAVIVVLWVTVSKSAQSLRTSDVGELLAVLAVALVAHVMLLALGGAAAIGFPRPQAIAILFVTAEKTLPLALSILVVVTALSPDLAAVAGDAVIVCVIWHFVQLFTDGLLAARLHRWPASTSARRGRPRNRGSDER